MCGITGFVSDREFECDSLEILQKMSRQIAHRGPDDEGFFETKALNGQYHIGLAHRRLSIIDLEGGHQPLSNEDGSIQIVYNGELYNFHHLRKKLIGMGHRFATNSDTETIVHLYETFGEQCVDHLRGMFAFAIWDGRNEKLFLARDRFGKKPLFIYKTNNGILFASEIKSLLLFPGLTPQVNKEAVWQYLAYRYVPGPDTLFSGICKLPPASTMVWHKGKITERRYFNPPDKFCVETKKKSIDPINEFSRILEDAVKIRLVSDVPFGAFLSGGIDSSAIVALMANHCIFPVKTFSVGFKENQYSELAYAGEIAKLFSTDHHELLISQEHILDELENLVYYRDAPVSEPSDIPIFLLAKEASKKVKMVLTGEGSDEILGGYPKHMFERYTKFYQKIPVIARRHLIESIVNRLPYKFRRAKTAITNLGLTDRRDRFPRWFGALSWEERQKLVAFQGKYETRNQMQFNTEKKNSPLRKILYFDQTSWLPDNLLERGDRMTMAASIEARMPFMDHKLANFVSSLPDECRIRGGTSKWILREAMKKIIPDSILKRPKVGFRVPVNEWFKGSMKEYLCDHLLGKNVLTSGYFHTKILKKIIHQHLIGRQNHEKLLWTLLNLEIWHRVYKIAP